MIADKSEQYISLDIQSLLNIGGNISMFEGIMLFDNLGGDEILPISEFAYAVSHQPVKLNSNIVIVCLSGCLDYNIDCSESLSVHAGEVAVFLHGQIVEFKKDYPDTRFVVVGVSSDIKTSMDVVADTFSRLGAMSINLEKSYSDTILEIYRLMRRTMERQDSRYKGRMLCDYLDVMYLSIHESTLKNRTSAPGTELLLNSNRQTEIYHAFVRLVKERFRQHRDVEYYAKSLCLSAGHLSRIVKKQSGKTVGEWIKEYIILEAKALLKSSTDAVYQISDALNFPNTSFFCRYFKEKTGMTPIQYRNS